MEIDQEIFNIMLAKSMHQIARIEFRNSKFPYAKGALPPCNPHQGALPPGPPPGGQPPGTPVIGQQFWAPPLSSGWIRPCLTQLVFVVLIIQ